jgi:hypothetical protein
MSPLKRWRRGWMRAWRWLWCRCELNDGYDAGTGGSGDWQRGLQMWRRGGKVRNPGGEPHGFIGATDVRSATVCLGLWARHDTPPHHIAGYAPTIPILSHQNRTGRFAFPSRPGLFSHRGDVGQKASFSARLDPGVQGPTQQSRWPSQRGMGPRATRTQAHKPQGCLDAQSSPSRANPRRIPANGILGFPSSCPDWIEKKNQNS